MKRSLMRISRFIHKWAGLILAVQILFWILGGLVMSAIPLEKVHGKHLAKRTLDHSFTTSDYSYSLDSIIAATPAVIKRIDYAAILDNPLYIITTDDNQYAYDGRTGKFIEAFNNGQIEQVATKHYLGKAALKQVNLLDNIPQEVAFEGQQIWQVVFADTWGTTIYLSPSTAQVVTVRSDIWRIFDFFWMLHIMDYDERENFNNPLLISFSASALIFTLSGIVLLFHTFRRRRRPATA